MSIPAVLVIVLGTVAPGHTHQLPGGLAAPPEAAGGAGRAAVLAALDRWDLPAARAALAALPPPRGAVEALLEAQVAYHEGDYAAAVRLSSGLPPSLAVHGPVSGFARLAAATLAMDARLATRESAHFVLRFDPERDWVLAEGALEALEAARDAHGGWLGLLPEGKVRVEIVPTAEDFERVSGLSTAQIETGGAIATCAFNRLMVLSPRLLARGYRWRDTLSHEYLHYLLVRLSANRAPIWLQEGVSRFGEARWRDPGPPVLDEVDRSLVARALREGALIPFAAMDPSLVSLPTPGAVRLAFAECALAIEHLLARWGDEGLRRLLARLAAAEGPPGTDAALRDALGVSFADFEAGWRQLVEAKGFVETPGVSVPAFRLAGRGDAAAWDLADWQPEEAANHLRLGDLLRARGNARAALAEYERARRAAPGSPFAHLKASRALLELGRAQEAETAARAAVRLAPDFPAAREALAAALAALGDAGGAAAQLREALEVNPFNPYDWRDLARLLRRLGEAGPAQRAAASALRLGPADDAFRRSVVQDY